MTETPEIGTEIPKKADPYFGGFILETLTIGMYGDSKSAIREYLQNSFDSLLLAVEKKITQVGDARIDITMSDTMLVIRDNGLGIGSARAVSVLTSVGASLKDFRSQAGFRGIGRLAGIVFCTNLKFVTKAQGETVQTTVTFNAKQLRQQMSPSHGAKYTLTELLEKNITASQSDGHEPGEHFFEVRLEGLVNPPKECLDRSLMSDFVGQVAPVGYRDDFSFAAQILKAGEERRFPSASQKDATKKSLLDQVRVLIKRGDEVTDVRKPYRNQAAVGKDDVPIYDIKIFDPPSRRWWAWIALKKEPGVYKDDRVRAMRVRMRNIQIDGTELMGKQFSSVEGAASFGRFNDWYAGEIFVDPTFVIPNARRDGFEEDDNWIKMQGELTELCADLGRQAYDISRRAQLSIRTLARNTKEIEDKGKSIAAAGTDTDKVIELSNAVNKLQRKVGRALRHADLETSSQLRSLENKLLDVKTRAVRNLGVSQQVDLSEVREQAQLDIISELMAAFRERLDPPTYSMVAKIASELLGSDDF